jgi:hypothetical protein
VALRNRFQMTEEEENRLLDELLDVLDRVVETSGCRDMVPLWMLATRAARTEHIRSVDGPPLGVPPHIQAWARSMRSKYAGLAAWRHAMLAERILEALDASSARAVDAIYFTPTVNEPPYSWSKASSRHPSATEWPSPTVLDLRARQGCRDSVHLLEQRVEEARRGASPAVEARAAIVETGARHGTLRDVLRYRDIERGETS